MIVCGDALEVLRSATGQVSAVVTDPPAGISFMGKKWDANKGGRDQWIEWLILVMRECHRLLPPGGHALVWALPRTSHWTATAVEDVGFEIRDVVTHHFGTGFPKSHDVSKAGAKRWEGFGTALKPASEHWILARKPLTGTVAANVLQHGTGVLNIDGCRVTGRWPANLMLSHLSDCAQAGTREVKTGVAGHRGRGHRTQYVGGEYKDDVGKLGDMTYGKDGKEEVPAWKCAPGCPVAELDAQSGDRPGMPRTTKRKGKKDGAMFNPGDDPADRSPGYGDKGGASRFFYTAKASKKERGEGNDHPTVKSLALMCWLVRLITPPGGEVLDPFMGSGTTGLACQEEGFGFFGIEQDQHYFEIARRRLGEED